MYKYTPMNLEAKNIPYENLEKIGLGKKEILGWNADEMKALLSGRTTQLKNIKDGEGKDVKAKISLYPNEDGSLGVRIHPIKEKVKIPEVMTKNQGEKLKEGKNVMVNEKSKNGIVEQYMYKVDNETNEVFKTRVENINIPKKLNGVELNNQQRKDLLNGKEITLNGEKISVDITKPNGYSKKAVEQEEVKGLDIKNDKPKESNINLEKEIKDKVKAGLIAGPLGMAVDETIKQVKGRR